MEPQITISEKLFKKLLRTSAILAGVSLALISFIWSIYKDCNEDGVTLFSINMALIDSIILGGILFTVFYLFNRKYWHKVIEDDKTEKTRFQKVCSIIILCSTLVVMLGAVLYANHLKIAIFVLWFGILSCVI